MYDVAQQREIMLDGIGDLEDVSDEAFLQEMCVVFRVHLCRKWFHAGGM